MAAGGALGALFRFGVGTWAGTFGRAFPWGTLAINVAGSLALGFLAVWLQAAAAAPELRAFVAVGLLGGFTTFSAFSWETVVLARNGSPGAALAYALGSVALGVLAAFAGMAAAQRLVGGSG